MHRSRQPRTERLASFVDRLWWCSVDADHPSETILPTGRAQLIIGLDPDGSTAIVQGPRSTPAAIDTTLQRRAIGVAFRAGGTTPFGAPASELADRFVPAEDVWGRSISRLGAELEEQPGVEAAFDRIEAHLTELLTDAGADDPAVDAAERALARGDRVDAVARSVGLDRRRLAARFRERYGFGPKRYGRLRRFERTVLALRRPDAPPLARLAATNGFADQAHLSREFRAFAGVPPATLHGRDSGSPNHLALDGDSFKTPHVERRTMGR